jgi:hypothetical protein
MMDVHEKEIFLSRSTFDKCAISHIIIFRHTHTHTHSDSFHIACYPSELIVEYGDFYRPLFF